MSQDVLPNGSMIIDVKPKVVLLVVNIVEVAVTHNICEQSKTFIPHHQVCCL